MHKCLQKENSRVSVPDNTFACNDAHKTPKKVKSTDSWEHEMNDEGKDWKTEVEDILLW